MMDIGFGNLIEQIEARLGARAVDFLITLLYVAVTFWAIGQLFQISIGAAAVIESGATGIDEWIANLKMLGVNLAVIGVVGCTMHLWSMRGIMTKNHRLAAQQEHLLAKQERLIAQQVEAREAMVRVLTATTRAIKESDRTAAIEILEVAEKALAIADLSKKTEP